MSLMRWFWKNNQKLMAVVVIVLMFVFVGSAGLSYLGKTRDGGGGQVVGIYGQKSKIKSEDIETARRELEILRRLGAELLFRPQDVRQGMSQDLRILVLGELLFSEQSGALETSSRLRQMIRTGRYRVSDKQINDVYRKQYPPELYWLLLKTEARQAGLRVSREDAAAQLNIIVPQLARGATYAQFMNYLVETEAVSEEQIQETFADLLAVLEYGRMICSVEDATLRQARMEASWQQETMDVEFVGFEAGVFAEAVNEPGQDEIAAHFEKCRKFSAGEVTEDNPYGLGYKLPDRVQLEYIVVKLDDAAAKVTAPTQEETEEYYQRNRQRFPEQASRDPNDPNAPVEQRTRPFAEVAAAISRELMLSRVNSKAEQILADARMLAEANLISDVNTGQISVEQLKTSAGNYEGIAAEIGAKHGIKLYAGRTDFLGALDISRDRRLGTLYLPSAGQFAGRGVAQIVFAVEQLGASELGPHDPPKPQMYETIGPVRDVRENIEGYTGKNMMLLRIIDVAKAGEPNNLDQVFKGKAIVLDDEQDKSAPKIVTIREKVITDLKKLAAMETAKVRAGEFVEEAKKSGWEAAVDKFNQLYGKKETEGREPNTIEAKKTFRLETFSQLSRMSEMALMTMMVRQEGDPTGFATIAGSKAEAAFLDKLYGLIPPDSNVLQAVPAIMEYKPSASYYCVKSLSINQLYEEDFQKVRGLEFYKEDIADAQALAFAHYSPENILKRMKFRVVEEKPDSAASAAADGNTEGKR